MISKDQRNHVINKLFIGDSHIEVQSNKFTIKGPNGHILFQVNDEEVSIATETLKLDSKLMLKVDFFLKKKEKKKEKNKKINKLIL